MLAKSDIHPARPGVTAEPSFEVKSVEDRILWEHLKKGNDLAFSILYKRYVQRLYNYGMHIQADKNFVVDSLQELFARLWDKRASLGDVTSVNFYLFKSYRRLLLHRIVKHRKFQLRNAQWQETENVFSAPYEETIIHGENQEEISIKLRDGIASLTKRQREAVFLRFFNNLSYEEIAVVMELRTDSVYNLISKAIEKLRKKLGATLFSLLF